MTHPALTPLDQQVVDLVYGLAADQLKWPTFRVVDLRMDRQLAIPDTRSALVAVPSAYLRRPWQAHGFNDGDEVRLTLRGIAFAAGGINDLTVARDFLYWMAEQEQSSDIDNSELVLTSEQFAAARGWHLEPET